jgi:hypothetical protein
MGNRASLSVKSGLKGGRVSGNHTRNMLRVKSGLKGGRITGNHARALLRSPAR